MSDTPPGLRAGIIGGGFMATVHSRAIRVAGGCVVAATGSTPERADRSRISTGASEAVATVDELLHRDDVDVVHVCTPNSSHEEFATRALAAGKWVVCEKPLATSWSAAASIVDEARRSRRAGTVPFVYRYHPMIREMRTHIANGALGALSVVHGSYLQDWLAAPDETNWRVDAAAGGRSRAFADIGSHWFDLFEFVTGDRVARVSAQAVTAFPRRNGTPTSTEDGASVHFTTVMGMIGSMVVSQVAAGRKNRLHLEVSGAQASFGFDQEQPELLWKGTRAGATHLFRDPGQLSEDAGRVSLLPAGHSQGYQDAFNAFIADSYAFFSTGRGDVKHQGIPTLDDGLRAAQLCDAVLDSVDAGGEWIDTPSQGGAGHPSKYLTPIEESR